MDNLTIREISIIKINTTSCLNTWLQQFLMLCTSINTLLPKSDLKILLCLTSDDFTRQRETP